MPDLDTVTSVIAIFCMTLSMLFIVVLVVIYYLRKKSEDEFDTVEVDPDRLTWTNGSNKTKYQLFYIRINDEEYAALRIDSVNNQTCDASGKVFCSYEDGAKVKISLEKDSKNRMVH